MSRFAIGDIHGCFDALLRLLAETGFEPGRDELFLTGDLINRGPKSLASLRWAKANAGCVRFVLGNHDLHLIASHLGVGRGDSRDTIQEILDAPDAEGLIGFLREAPLTISEKDFFLVHAGIHPAWSLETAEERARKAAALIRSEKAPLLLTRAHVPARELTDELAEARESLAYLTRLRACGADGRMEERYTGPRESVPQGYRPWFEWLPEEGLTRPIVFGHWAALDVMVTNRAVCLDSGCVWKRALTAIDLGTHEIIQVPAEAVSDAHAHPGKDVPR